MKSLGFCLVGLLCCTVLASAQTTEGNEPEIQPIINLFNYESDSTALPIYGLSLYKMTWFDAELYCASQGYTLASIPSATEQTAIMKFIRDNVSDSYDLMALNSEPIWTSGTNQAAVSQYMWRGNGTRVGYSNFQTNPRTNAYYCMTLNGLTGFWSTDNCRAAHYFLCEKKCKG